MKKTIIALSVMAIASLGFNSSAVAGYREKDLKEAQSYIEYLAKYKLKVEYKYVDFEVKEKFAKQVCIEGSFDKAMDKFKKPHYSYYVSVLKILNQDRFEIYAYKQDLKSLMSKYCPKDKIIYPAILKN